MAKQFRIKNEVLLERLNEHMGNRPKKILKNFPLSPPPSPPTQKEKY
jgi:hypothetical protein